MVQRAPHAPSNPSPRASRWTQLWRPLLRLSLGLCLGFAPFVFAVCGVFEGVSHAQGHSEEDDAQGFFQFDNAQGYYQFLDKFKGIQFWLSDLPPLPVQSLKLYTSQQIFGLTPEQDARLRQKERSFPKMRTAFLSGKGSLSEIRAIVEPAYYRQVVLQEKLHLSPQIDVTPYHIWFSKLPVWHQHALYYAAWLLVAMRGELATGSGSMVVGGKDPKPPSVITLNPSVLRPIILDEILISQYHKKPLSSPREEKILQATLHARRTASQQPPSTKTSSGTGHQGHPVTSATERASYELDVPATAPAYPASIKGPDQLAAGASAVYTMALDTPEKLPAHEVYYSFALYNITPLVQKGLAEQLSKDALANKDLANGEEVTHWAAKRRDLSQRLENFKTDTKTAAKGVIHPLTHGGPLREEAPAALINLASLYLTEASALVSLGGFVAGSFVDWVAGAAYERQVPAPTTPGYYLLRSIGTPRPTLYERRASSVAVKIIEVRTPEYWAKEARDADERALLELTLKEKTTQDPKALAEIKQQQQALRTAAQQPLENLLTGQQATLQKQMQLVPFDAINEREALRVRLANVDARLRLVRKYNPRFQDITRTVRVKAGFASSEASLTVPLFLQLGRLSNKGGRSRYGLLDATVPDGDLYDATGATEEEAIWKVFERFAGHAGYGRGSLAVTLPASDKLPALGTYTRVLDCHPTGTSLLKNRLQDLSIVLTLLSLPVSSVGGVALLLGGALSAVRLYDRFEHDTLKWDFEAVTDTLMVLGAASSAVGTLGKFVRVQVQGGTRFALAAQGTNVAQLTAVLRQVEAGMAGLGQVIGVGGLVVGNLGMLKQLKQIEEQELAGTITHTEALQQRSDVLFQGLLTNVLFVKGLNSKAKEATPVATPKELPPVEQGAYEPPLGKLTPSQEALLRRGPSTTPPGPPGLKDAPVPGPNKPTKKPGGTAQAPESVEAQVPVVQEQVLAATGTDGAAQQTDGTPTGTAPKKGAGLTVMGGGNTGAGGTGTGGTGTGGTGGNGTSGGGTTSEVGSPGTVAPARGSTGSTGTRGQAPKEIAPSSQGPALAPEGSSPAAGVATPEQGAAPTAGAKEIAPGSRGPALDPEGTPPPSAPPQELSAHPDLVARLAPDLAQQRAGLSPQARQRWDAKMRRLAGREPWNGTHEAVLRTYLESLAPKGGVEAGLTNDRSLAPERQVNLPPPPKPPYGASARELPLIRAQAIELLRTIEAEEHTFRLEGIKELKQRIKNALSTDFQKMERGEMETTHNQTQGARGNLKGIEAEWNRAKAGHRAGNNVVRVSLEIDITINGEKIKIQIDVVEKGGRRWIETKAGEPPRPGTIAEAELLLQLQDMLTVAQESRFHVQGKPPEVVVSFAQGQRVSPSLEATLTRMGVRIEMFSQGVLR